jgi:copper(I)-binding protein
VVARKFGEGVPVIFSSRGARPLRGALIVAAAALIPAIAGCEAGLNAPTQEWHQPTPGASAVVDNTMRINNMFVLGPVPGNKIPAGASAGLFFALNNGGPFDRLISITAPGSASSVHVPIGGIAIGRDQSLLFTGPAPRVLLQGLTRTLHGGQYVVMNLNFQNAGHVTMLVPVMPRAAFYVTYSPAPQLAATPTATPTATPVPTPAPTPTASS